MGLNQNTWKLNQWYDQDVAGNVSYSGPDDPGSLWGWGRNNNGDLAQGTHTNDRSSPVQIPGTNWLFVSSGFTHAATKTDGTLWSWGYNQGGQLGQNNRTSRSSPIQIPGSTWKSITTSYSTIATKTDGTLWAWGHDINGSLGINEDGERYSSPVQVGGGTDWDEVIVSTNHTVGAIKTDGTLWMWGNNHRGQLAQNNETKRSSPVQVPGTWKSYASASYSTTSAIRTDGTLWGWGDNEYGETGDNSNTLRSSPSQIGSDTTWKQVTQSNGRGMAVKTDGTLWGWGNPTFGANMINDGDTKRSSPVQVGSGTDWDLVVQGADFSLASKTDGTIWASGIQELGQLGNNVNSNVCLSSPVQVPGTNWMLAKTIMTDGSKTALVRQQA
jgi:alpha-tubulin suppressor-like RCC1 family protein